MARLARTAAAKGGSQNFHHGTGSGRRGSPGAPETSNTFLGSQRLSSMWAQFLEVIKINITYI